MEEKMGDFSNNYKQELDEFSIIFWQLIKMFLIHLYLWIYLTIQNKISKSILKNNNLLKNSKDDKINHGLGLYSIKRTIENNKGLMDIFEKDNWFTCNIILPINNKKHAN